MYVFFYIVMPSSDSLPPLILISWFLPLQLRRFRLCGMYVCIGCVGSSGREVRDSINIASCPTTTAVWLHSSSSKFLSSPSFHLSHFTLIIIFSGRVIVLFSVTHLALLLLCTFFDSHPPPLNCPLTLCRILLSNHFYSHVVLPRAVFIFSIVITTL